MAEALVLNATYEPLCVVSQRRALILVLTDKAVMVEAGGQVLHSAASSVEVPVVVRLARFVRVPYRSQVPLTRKGVLARDHHRCVYCGAPATSLDHGRQREGDSQRAEHEARVQRRAVLPVLQEDRRRQQEAAEEREEPEADQQPGDGPAGPQHRRRDDRVAAGRRPQDLPFRFH